MVVSKSSLINILHEQRNKKYRVKGLDNPKLFRNWVVQYNNDGSVHISQRKTIETVLEHASLGESNPTLTPHNDIKPADQQQPTPKIPTTQAQKSCNIIV